MIDKERQITELYELKHRNDYAGENNMPFDYENNLYQKTLSNVMFRNTNLVNFISYLQKSSVYMIESMLYLRNFFNFTVDKDYNKHLN